LLRHEVCHAKEKEVVFSIFLDLYFATYGHPKKPLPQLNLELLPQKTGNAFSIRHPPIDFNVWGCFIGFSAS